MPRNPTDDFFTGAKSESYFNSRRELKKHEVTGEAIKILQDFIEEHLNKPYWREVFIRNKVQRVYNK